MNAFSKEAQHSLEVCRGYTKLHGVEYCTFLKKDQELFSKAGEYAAVCFTRYEVESIKRAKPDLIVHSHPRDTSLSLCDLQFAQHFNVIIAAITPKGDIYWADGNNTGKALAMEGYNLGKKLGDITNATEHSKIKDLVETNWYHMLWTIMRTDLGLDYGSKICCDTAKEIDVIKPVFDSYHNKCIY